mgnify:FL=1
MSTERAKSNNAALLLASIREHLGRGKSLYESLLKEGVPKEAAEKILSLHAIEEENSGHQQDLGSNEIISTMKKLLKNGDSA